MTIHTMAPYSQIQFQKIVITQLYTILKSALLHMINAFILNDALIPL